MRLINVDKLKRHLFIEYEDDIGIITHVYQRHPSIIQCIESEQTINEDKGVRIIWSSQINDIINDIKSLETYKALGTDDPCVKLNKVVEILQDAIK